MYLCIYACGCVYIYIYIIIIIIIKSFISHYPSLSSIIPGRSYRLHPVSAQSWCIYIFTGQSTLVCPYVGIHKRMLLMSWSFNSSGQHVLFVLLGLLFFCEMETKWPYSCCFVSCFFHDLFKTALNIFGSFLSSFFSMCFMCVCKQNLTIDVKIYKYHAEKKNISIIFLTKSFYWYSVLKIFSGEFPWHNGKSGLEVNSSHIVIFTFSWIPLGKAWTPLFPQL